VAKKLKTVSKIEEAYDMESGESIIGIEKRKAKYQHGYRHRKCRQASRGENSGAVSAKYGGAEKRQRWRLALDNMAHAQKKSKNQNVDGYQPSLRK